MKSHYFYIPGIERLPGRRQRHVVCVDVAFCISLTTVATHPFALFTSVNCCELSVMAFFKVMCVAVALSEAAVGATVLPCPH
jgi:hypothetical protein